MLNIKNIIIEDKIYESLNSMVLKGFNRVDEIPVLVKILTSNQVNNSVRQYLKNEFELLKSLSIKGVRNVIEYDTIDNLPFIIMEYIDGNSLKDYSLNKNNEIEEFLDLAIQLCEILGDIHKNNIIHKDINPNNILIDRNGQVYIIDFGISTKLSIKLTNISKPENLEGTLAYISPEQTGRINRTIDYRTDIYSLGVTFYELITGRLPFTNKEPIELIHSHITKKETSIIDLLQEKKPNLKDKKIFEKISEIISRLLCKKPEDRYQSAYGIKNDLLQVKKLLSHEIFDFIPGQKDFNEKLIFPEILYGRENELSLLTSKIEEIKHSNPSIVLISGYSGIGKTSLVYEIQKPFIDKYGYFLEGKFEEYNQNIPYYAISSALNKFCRYILMESAQVLEYWKNKILAAIGENAQILIDIIPDLELIIGKQEQAEVLGTMETKNRFNLSFIVFMKTICQSESPIVLFLDDLQWADNSSFELLKLLLKDEEIRNLLIISTYRDLEIKQNYSFLSFIDKIQFEGTENKIIHLSNLKKDDVAKLLEIIIKQDENNIIELSNIIYKKTEGNPFFIKQFLYTLYEKYYLFIDHKGGEAFWNWDIEKIEKENLTENVIFLLTEKIKNLDEGLQEVLKIASCFGHLFSLQSISKVLEAEEDQVLKVIVKLIELGYLIPLSENFQTIENENLEINFGFIHDRVLEASYQLLEQQKKELLHFKIMNVLSEKSFNSDKDENIFELVTQANKSLNIFKKSKNTILLMNLNISAGEKALNSIAYENAFNYLSYARNLMHPEYWEINYTKVFNLYKNLVICSYILGKIELVERLTIECKENIKNSIEDLCEIKAMKIPILVSEEKLEEAKNLSLELVTELNFKISKNPSKLLVFKELLKLKIKYNTKKMSNLIHVSKCEEKKFYLIQQIFIQTGSAYFFSNPLLLLLTLVNNIELLFQKGYTPDSSGTIMTYAILNIGLFDDLVSGLYLADLAIEFSKKVNSRLTSYRNEFLYYIFLGHWRFNYKTFLSRYENIGNNLLSVGDLEFASYALFQEPYQSIILGEDLEDIEKLITKNKKTIQLLNQKNTSLYISQAHQFIENLIYEVKNPIQLIGEKFDFNENEENLIKEKNYPALLMSHFMQCMLGYLFESYQYSYEQFDLSKQFHESGKILMMFTYFRFYKTLSLIQLIKQNRKYSGFLFRLEVIKEIKKFKKYSEYNPEFYKSKYLILLAEYKSLNKNKNKARKIYLDAILSSKDSEVKIDISLAYELSGKYLLEQNEIEFGVFHIKKAYDMYLSSKMKSKCKQLEGKYSYLNLKFSNILNSNYSSSISESTINSLNKFTNKGSIQLTGNSISSSVDFFDFQSIVETFQALTGEIDLEKLLKKIMETALTNAGAEHAYLILPDRIVGNSDTNWIIKAEGHINKEILVIDIDKSRVPLSIINLVQRTKNIIVLDNAFQKGQFTHDPYIQMNQIKSVFCLPLIKQGKLNGILYLENNLITNAFTKDRIKILQVIASQAAISLENAGLYDYQVELTNSYSRFVPAEYLEILQKASVTEVKLGDFIAGEMTVMFSDIRSFTTLSETMTAQENFNFVNAYFKRVSPVIAENHGIILKYIGDAIMSVFKYKADDAVKSAIEEWNIIKEYNKDRIKRGYIPITSGFGINTGYMMLGMVGEENRMQGDVFSDHVNLASRLEGLTKYYGIPLIVSENVYANMKNKESYTFRYLDNVRVKGKNNSIRIYEVLEIYDEETREKKQDSLEEYKKGIYLYIAGKLKDSIEIFKRLEKQDPEDPIISLYKKRIEYFLLNGIPDTWTGVNVFDSK